MSSGDNPHVGVMLLAHHRPWLLPFIVDQALSEFKAFVDITVDRPSADVLAAVDKLSCRAKVRVFEAPHPALDGRDRFIELRQFQLERAQELAPRYGVLWDDDHILEQPQEGRFWMAKGFDLIYIKKRFLWDRIDSYNARMLEHNSVFFFKMLEGDRFPAPESGRVIHAPLHVHDSADSRTAQMNSFLLDAGYLWPEERERVFRAYAQAGKIDGATMPLMQSPNLIKRPPAKKSFWVKKVEAELECLSRKRV